MKISALMWVCERRLCGADGVQIPARYFDTLTLPSK